MNKKIPINLEIQYCMVSGGCNASATSTVQCLIQLWGLVEVWVDGRFACTRTRGLTPLSPSPPSLRRSD